MPYPIMDVRRIVPWGQSNTETPEHMTLEEKIKNEKRHFVRKKSMDNHKESQYIKNLYIQGAYDELEQIYMHGFTLGALLLMMEVMENKEGVIEVFEDPESEVRDKAQYYNTKIRPRETPVPDNEIE